MVAEISVSGGTGTELGDLQFVLTLSEPSLAPVTVNYRTIGGTALEGGSFQDILPEEGTVTIAAGATTATLNINPSTLVSGELDENFTVEFFDPTNATLAGNARLLIANGTILEGSGTSLFVVPTLAYEGLEEAVFTVLLSKPLDDDLALAFSTVDNTARAGEDYTATSGTLTFLAGQTQAAVVVPLINDGLNDANETFSLVVTPTFAIANGTDGSTSTATILDGFPLRSSAAAFDYTVTYASGDSYGGVVFDDGRYGYAEGTVVDLGTDASGNAVTATIGEAAPVAYDKSLAGQVYVSSYYDSAADASYLTWTQGQSPAGFSGLGSEMDQLLAYGDTSFGGGVEAVPQAAVFYYYWVAPSGDAYSGWVFDDGRFGHFDGQILTSDFGGTGAIYAATDAIYDPGLSGQVYVDAYYDATFNALLPTVSGAATAVGLAGIGSEFDQVNTPNGPVWFGGGLPAVDPFAHAVSFAVSYGGGDVYYGMVYDDGRYGYSDGQVIDLGLDESGDALTATITGVDTTPVDPGLSGQVFTSVYYDAEADAFYSTVSGGLSATGTAGIGSEVDAIAALGDDTAFGQGQEASPAASPFFYYWALPGGDFYSGFVYDDGRLGYAPGDSIASPFGGTGAAFIVDAGAAEADAALTGQVFIWAYFDAQSNTGKATDSGGMTPVGFDGLGSEFDTVDGAMFGGGATELDFV
ncbi:MAG: Calx-beta domain-containing protein [Actinomycetota bacterium]